MGFFRFSIRARGWPLAALLALACLAGPAWAENGTEARPVPLHGLAGDYDPLLARIGHARFVLLGEATHGSREFYRERARIALRLIDERGFSALVIEAPWEPVRRLDAYIRGEGRDRDAAAALSGFFRFPRWMWRNAEFRDFIETLRQRNAERPAEKPPIRIYGMDIYSVPESADAVVRHLARRSIDAAELARSRYACFDAYWREPDLYGRDVVAGRLPGCAEGAAAQLAELADRPTEDDDDFAAAQSARVVHDGEAFYRAMHRGDGVGAWNLRERHMAETLARVAARENGIIVWAQNVHQGDARATDQAQTGELSLGQLVRERHGDTSVVLVGFTTHRGRVRAAGRWGGPDRVHVLRKARADSWSGLLRGLRPPGSDNFLLIPGDDPRFLENRLQRAVGVVYRPGNERASHYFHARLGRQFDVVMYHDVTSAVEPLID